MPREAEAIRVQNKGTADYEYEARQELLGSIDMDAPGLLNVLEDFGIFDLKELNTIPFSRLQEIAKYFDVIGEGIVYDGDDDFYNYPPVDDPWLRL